MYLRFAFDPHTCTYLQRPYFVNVLFSVVNAGTFVCMPSYICTYMYSIETNCNAVKHNVCGLVCGKCNLP